MKSKLVTIQGYKFLIPGNYSVGSYTDTVVEIHLKDDKNKVTRYYTVNNSIKFIEQFNSRIKK